MGDSLAKLSGGKLEQILEKLKIVSMIFQVFIVVQDGIVRIYKWIVLC